MGPCVPQGRHRELAGYPIHPCREGIQRLGQSPRDRSAPNSSAHERNDRRHQADRSASRAIPGLLTTGSSRLSSASASRVPCRNSIGILTSARCLALIAGRLSGRMQRKAQKRQSANAGQGRKRLRLRRHPPAERSATRDQRQRGTAPPGFRHRRRGRAACATAGASGRLLPFSI